MTGLLDDWVSNVSIISVTLRLRTATGIELRLSGVGLAPPSGVATRHLSVALETSPVWVFSIP